VTNYCFTSECGQHTIEASYPMGHAPSKIARDGRYYWRDLRAEHTSQKSGDAWTNHWSLSMGARTPEDRVEIAEKCAAAGVSCQFDSIDRIKVDSAKHQRKLADAIFGKGKVRNLDSYY
jgi:hypothetical protein